MKLSLKDRLALPFIMPQSSRYIERMLIQSILHKTEITAKEIEQFEISETEIGIVWNKDKTIDIDIELTKEEMAILSKAAKAADESEKVTDNNCDLIGKLLNIPA